MEKDGSFRTNTQAGVPGSEAIADSLHQLNQPLTAISNYAQAGCRMLSSGIAEPQQLRELFEKITEQAARCSETSRELRRCLEGNGEGHE